MNEKLNFLEFLKQLPCSVYWKDRNGVYLGCNNFMAKACGLSNTEEIIGKIDFDLSWWNTAEELRRIDDEVIKTGEGITIEETGRLADGTQAICLSTKMPLRNKKNEIIGVFGVSMDITHQKQKELILREEKEKAEAADLAKFNLLAGLSQQLTGIVSSEEVTAEEHAKNTLEYLENLLDSIPGNIYWMNRNCVYLGCNNNSAKLMGLNSTRDVIGKTYIELAKSARWIEGQADSFKRDDMEVMTIGIPKYNVEEPPVPSPDGEQIYYLTTRVPLRDKKGNIIGVVGNSVDITDRKHMEQELKLAKENAETANEAIKIFAASIAHELRTPLASISGNVYGITKYLPILIDAYQQAKEADLPISKIRPDHYQSLTSLSNNIGSEIEYAKIIIDMLLMKTNSKVQQNVDFKVCSINICLTKALSRYPFKSDKEQNLITWDNNQDFLFRGVELFMIHAIFNLIKNALYYIEAARKGEINIWLETGANHNYLHFQDTGKGIAKNVLPYIFDSYFSKTPNGAGVGLAFCKQVMHNFSGNIECQSKEGEYTHFILSFPKEV